MTGLSVDPVFQSSTESLGKCYLDVSLNAEKGARPFV